MPSAQLLALVGIIFAAFKAAEMAFHFLAALTVIGDGFLEVGVVFALEELAVSALAEVTLPFTGGALLVA